MLGAALQFVPPLLQNGTEEAMDQLEDLLLARCIVLDAEHPELRQHVVPAQVGPRSSAN